MYLSGSLTSVHFVQAEIVPVARQDVVYLFRSHADVRNPRLAHVRTTEPGANDESAKCQHSHSIVIDYY